MEWKKEFLDRYKELTDLDEFLEYSLKPLKKSIRVNTLKVSVKEIKRRFKLKEINWCEEGFFIKGEAIGNTLEHFLGYIYMQEAASMIPARVLNPKDVVLDMCASPGSKTTQMAAMMNNKGMIIANDISIGRLKPLSINLERCGVMNVIINRSRGQFIKGSYDNVLVDAPCSGVGTIRKSYKTIKIWNAGMIRKLSMIQKHLLINGFKCLKEDGELVYSTCTTEPEENEEVVSHLLDKFDNAKICKINLDIRRSKPVEEFKGKVYNSDVKDCLRIWPQDNDTEGFFVAKIKK